MAKNSIRDYSATASSNTDVQSVNIDENCPASGINNALREILVDLKNVSTGAVALETPAADSLSVTGTVTAGGVNIGTGSDTGENNIQISNNSVTSFLGVEGSSGNRFIGSSTNNAFFGTTGADGLEFATNNNVRMKIDSSGSVGIGTTSPATATGGGIDIERAAGASVRIEDTTNSVTGELQIFSAGMNLATATNHNIIISPNNSEIARFTTDGLTFNGDTAAANALDDYETGTWTPSVGGTATYTSTNYGRYVKVGDMVMAQFNLAINAIGTGLPHTVVGLPYTSENIGWIQSGCVSFMQNLAVATNFIAFYLNNNSTSINFTGNISTTSNISLNQPHLIGNNTIISGSITYRAA